MAADISTLALEVDSTAVVRGRKDLDDLGAAGARSEGAATKVTSAWRAFSGVMATLGLGLAIRELVQVADTMSLLDSRLKLATKSSAEFLAAQADIYRIAQQNNVGIKETTELYVKLSKPIRDLGGSTKEVAGIADAFAKSLRVGGASAQEASSATLQFAQAMASGKLSGDEFRSLAEASPRFMQALADGLGVSTGSLKEMSTQGKLTADVVGNALLKSLTALTKESESMPDTVGGAFTRMANDAKVAIGELNKSSGMTLGIAEAIESIRSLIPSIKQEIQGVVTTISDFFDRNKQSLTEVWSAAVGFGSSLWEVAKAAGSIVGFFLEVLLQSGAVKTTIEAIRLVIAGVIDGVTFLGGVFATLGSLIMKGVTAPLQAVLTISANIAGLFDGELAAKIQGINSNIKDFVGAGAKYGDEVAARFMNGETAVGRLNAELANTTVKTKSASSEVTKLAGAFDSLGGAGGAKDATPAKISEYEKIITSIREKIALQEAELNRGRELTKAEQLSASVTADLASGKLKLSRAQKENIDSAIALYDSTERLNEAKRSSAKLYEQTVSSAIKENQTIQQQIEALNLQTEEVGKSEYALALLAEARLYDAAAQKEAMAAMADGEDLTGRLGELYRKQAEELRKLAAAKLDFANVKGANDLGIQSLAEATKQIEDFQSYIDKIDSSRLDGMFNGALKGIDKLITATKALGTLNEKSDKAKLAAIDKYGKGSVEVIKIENATLENQIGLYSDIAGAAKSMFAEGSKGYQALSVAQSALAVATGIAAIANQGLGDPYTAIPRMIAMAATLAQLGIAVNGISGGSSKPVTNQGTGTVFGDSTAKSASIENSIELLADTSKLGLRYSAQMASSLKNIEAAFAGVTNLLLRNGQIGELEGRIQTGYVASSTQNTAANRLIAASGSFAQGLQNKLFGNKISIRGSGILGGPQSFGDIQDIGFQGNYYADIETKKKFLGITRSTRNSTTLSALDAELADQFTKIFVGIGDSVTAAAGALGIRTETVQDALSKYIVDIGKIDLKDLTGEEIQAKLSAVFGAESDKIAAAVVPGFERIQKVGEGYFETLVRAATQLESVNTTFSLLGGSLSLVSKNADTFLEKISGGFRTAPGVDRAIVADQLVQQFGGLEDFNEATNSFYEAFYSRGERTQNTLRLLGTSLEGIDVALPSSISAWRDLTTSLDITTDAGRQAFETLITLGPTFAELQNELLSAAGISAGSIADVLRDGLTGRITQEDLGKKLSEIVVDGFNNALANGVADSISQSFTNQIIAPMLQAIATGGVVSAAVSQATIDDFVSQAEAQIKLYTEIVSSPAIQTALAQLNSGLTGVTSAMGGLTAASQQAAAAASEAARYTANGADIARANSPWIQAAEDAQRAANEAQKAWAGIGETIANEIKRIRGEIIGGDTSSALAQFATITAQTRARSQEAAKLLPSASQAFLAVAKESAVSLLDYRRQQAYIMGSLAETNSMLGINGVSDAPISGPGSTFLSQNGVGQQASIQLLQEIQTMRSILENTQQDLIRLQQESNQNTKKTADLVDRVTERGENMLVKDAP